MQKKENQEIISFSLNLFVMLGRKKQEAQIL